MDCWHCKRTAVGACRFCGRGICEDHVEVHPYILELFKSKELDFDRRIHDERRKAELDLWVPLVQFSHHGSDHRSQIVTILTLNGLDAPWLDVWAYATAEGAYKDL